MHRFGPDGQALNCTDHMSSFMGPGKLSSLVTTLSNCPSLLQSGLWRENEVAQDDGWTGRSLGTKISSREQRSDFDLVGTSRKVVVREPERPRVQHVVRFFPCRVYNNLNLCDTLGYE
jgi:hypothetical protein